MTRNDFIFSDQRLPRITRHVVFWLAWCIAFNILFHYPLHVFKGWDTSGPGTKNYQALGPVLFFIKSLLVNSLLGVIVPQVLLTYVVIYWLLPHYYYKKKYPALVIVVTAVVLLLYYFIAGVFKYAAPLYNQIMGSSPSGFPAYDSMLQIVLIDQVSTLPIILGLALLIKNIKRWWLKQKQTEQLVKEKTKAELQLLKAQVHPHFLFNTINNIYYYTLTNSAQAPVMIKKLSGLLSYIIHECTQPLVPLEKEINMLEDYMALEKIRYSEGMQMKIEVTGSYENKLIAPLLLIPFVENSFKHGASKMITQPWVNLDIRIENGWLNFIIKNSKPATDNPATSKGKIGLKNVEKRLSLLYPSNHKLSIINEADCFTVRLDLRLYDADVNKTLSGTVKPRPAYELA